MSFQSVSPASDGRQVREVLAGAMQGRTNNTGTVTLRANETTTTLLDPRIGPASVILLMPVTATAAAASLYVSARGKQTATLSHGSDAATDRTFAYAVIG